MRCNKPLILSAFFGLLSFWGFSQEDHSIVMEELEIVGEINSSKPLPIGSSQRITDVVHIRLDVHFNFEERAAEAKAEIYCTPYARDLDTVTLDAQAFDLNRVAIWKNAEWLDLKYKYNGEVLKIALNETQSVGDTFKLFIDYVARPDNIQKNGGSAITDAKGLYFVNPDKNTNDFMPQVWTQGEPECNSAWFPTVDKPNEKITHEIAITVDSSWVTLSNGYIDFATFNGNGTRTDYWTMKQPHAPYLVMMAAGKFEIVEDEWEDVPVNYFVESEWVEHAKRIFGNTPEMIAFFSNITGVPYPWNKYDQVVVRNYVSGAMENTTAVVHGDFLYTDEKEYEDETHEDVVAHELFHQWFGDLVTCESWGQLPLNESFATYGEYLWIEYKYGKDEADWHLEKDLQNYLAEFNYGHRPKMIRDDVKDPNEMFDNHSYAKGARILHMLRNYLGDEIFYKGMQNYLSRSAYGTAEIHNLRMAFENASGEDLNWFFDQWFLAKGHPVLDISYHFNKDTKQQEVTVKQIQDIIEYPLYIIPVKISVNNRQSTEIHEVVLNKQEQTFKFNITGPQPTWVSFDVDKMLLLEKEDHMSDAFLLSQLAQSKLMLDRREAVIGLGQSKNKNLRSTIAGIAMKDVSPYVRIEGLEILPTLSEAGLNKLLESVKLLAKQDSSSMVRSSAIKALSNVYNLDESEIYTDAWNAKSYKVNSEALRALCKHNPELGLKYARLAAKENNENLRLAFWNALSMYGEKGDLEILSKSILELKGDWYLYGIRFLGKYAFYHSNSDYKQAVLTLENIYNQTEDAMIKQRCKLVLNNLLEEWNDAQYSSSNKKETKQYESLSNWLSQKLEAL